MQFLEVFFLSFRWLDWLRRWWLWRKQMYGTRCAFDLLGFKRFKLEQIKESRRLEHDRVHEQFEMKTKFAALIRKYGLEQATDISKAGPEIVDLALREGQEGHIGEPNTVSDKVKREVRIIQTLSEKDERAAKNLEAQAIPLGESAKSLKEKLGQHDQELESIRVEMESLIELQKMLEEYTRGV